jgi:phospholipid/cholesterol/gamma-HCH transport system permease protein
MFKLIENFGWFLLNFCEEIGDVVFLFVSTLRNLFRGAFRISHTLAQMVRVGVDSIPVTLLTAASVGMVFAVQIAGEFVKYGAGRVVGLVLGIAIARELAPVLTGVVVAGRVGASIAAELGTMKVTEQIDALESLATNPVKYLVVPRFLACLAMLPVLTVFADVVGFVGGYLVSIHLVNINPSGYMDYAQRYLTLDDVFGGLIKSAVFGILIALIACYKGLSAREGARGVGQATTNAVVAALISIFIFNYFLSLLIFK